MTWFADNPLERLMRQKPLPIWRNREKITPSGGQRPLGDEIVISLHLQSDLHNIFTEVKEAIKRG